MPKDVLEEYEGVVTAAGYLPGAVLPSTLAALAGLDAAEAPALVVNVGLGGVTTAIVKGGVLLLHRTLDLKCECGDLSWWRRWRLWKEGFRALAWASAGTGWI